MNKKNYLGDHNVEEFCRWLSKRIRGKVTINFHSSHPKAVKLEFLHDGLFNYGWPDRTNKRISKVSRFLLPLSKSAGFLQNKKILDEITQGLGAALQTSSDQDFADWAMATMEWGGVSKNNVWIRNNTVGLIKRVDEVRAFLSKDIDDVDVWLSTSRFQAGGPKFNAGWTKVYSLIGENFIIYDSRVAAALAWLVCMWAKESQKTVVMGDLLAFGCLSPSEGLNPRYPKVRNPLDAVFPQIDQQANEHLRWNIRANWVLEKSFRLAGRSAFSDLRELEASLFTLGYALNGARCVSQITSNKVGPAPKGGDVKERKENKVDIARRIFHENPGLTRKEIIKKFVEEAGLTKNGANTYFQNLKKKS